MAETLRMPEAKAAEAAKPTLVPVQIIRGYWPVGMVEGYDFPPDEKGNPNPLARSLPPGAMVKLEEDEAQRLIDIEPPAAKVITEKAYQQAKAAKGK